MNVRDFLTVFVVTFVVTFIVTMFTSSTLPPVFVGLVTGVFVALTLIILNKLRDTLKIS